MKKLIITSSFLILSSTVGATSVGGSIGGWNVVSQVANGIGQKITATKNVVVNGASKVVTGTANLTPNPGNVARFAAKVGAVAVVSEAFNQLLDGVDWVLDPANNTIVKTNFIPYSFRDYYYPQKIHNSGSEACKALGQYNKETNGWVSFTLSAAGSYPNYSCVGTAKKGSTTYTYKQGDLKLTVYKPIDVTLPENRPVIPLSEVASQVITQAQEDIRVGNTASPAVALTRAVAQDMAAEAETDDVKARPIAQQFEQNQSVPTQEDSTGTIDTPEVVDPVTGEVVKPGESASISMKWPKACEWFPTLCIFIDWMQKPHELDEPELPTQELEKKEIDEDLITVNGSHCPAPIPVNIPLPVFNTTYSDSIDISDYCPKIKDLAPVLQLLAFVLAVMIIREI